MSEETAAGPQQSIVATQGTVQDVIQAIVTGTVTGDVHIGNIVYTRSAVEELREYLSRAVAEYSLRMYEAVYEQAEISHPYKFLDAFGIEDAPIFCGRDTAIEALARKVGSHRLTVLHAKSGAGKTSLLQAGLSPHLFKQGRLPLYVRTSDNPIQAIKRAITASLHNPWPTLLADLDLPVFLGMVGRFLKGRTKELVIMLDQFEEFFRFSLDAEQRRICIRELADCYDNETLPVRWLISLRKDYFSDLAEVERISPSLQVFRNEYLLSAMIREEAQEAIIGPVVKLDASVRYAPDLLETLLDDLERSGMELPLLQMLCTQLYKQRAQTQDSLTLEAYKALGQAAGVLRGYLSKFLTEHGEQGALAKTILKALVRSDGLKQEVSERMLAALIRVQKEQLVSALGHLIDARLIHREEVDGEYLYELAHEYLITEIGTWIEPADLEFKEVEELLLREIINWRVHHSLIPSNRLEILYTQRNRFVALDIDTWACLIRSAFVANLAVEDWFQAVSDDNKSGLFEAIKGIFITPVKEENTQVRSRIVQRLGALKDPRAVEPLITALQDKNWEVRGKAVDVLGVLKDQRAVEPLITVVQQNGGDVRRKAVRALRILKDPRAVEPIIAALQDKLDEWVRASAAEALGVLKDPRAVEPLITALQNQQAWGAWGVWGRAWARKKAAEALGALKDPRAVEPLITALQDKWDGGVRGSAARALGVIKDPRAVEPLIAALQDRDEEVRRKAVQALGQIGTSEAFSALQNIKNQV